MQQPSNDINSLFHAQRKRERKRKREMGSLFKMSNNSHNSQRGGNKPYALVLLLAFVAAILGVMVLHKLREKRIFTLLIKEKHQQLLTLNLLFQREKELNQEARKRIEEMKTKVYTLRTQKIELDRRVSEMESTISSLKDERKVIELALDQEKKNELKMVASEAEENSIAVPLTNHHNNMIIKMKDSNAVETEALLKLQQLSKQEKVKITGKKQSKNDGELSQISRNYTSGNSTTKELNRIQKQSNDSSIVIQRKKFEDSKKVKTSNEKEEPQKKFEKTHDEKDQLAVSEKLNQTTTAETEGVDDAEESGRKKKNVKIRELQSEGESNEKTEDVEKKQFSDENNMKVMKKHENDDNVVEEEQGNGNEEGGDQGMEDSEDGESHHDEPEIDRDDIKRLSESDPDTDEEAEEPEF